MAFEETIRSDISTRDDVEKLVDTFYDRVMVNPTIGPFFRDIDWVVHKPIMYSFWSSIVFGDRDYQGNPFQKHLRLKLGEEHFKEWLNLFGKTVDDLFEGENATEIKNRAFQIGAIFQHKFGLKPTP
jgi:hemoglobin